MQIYTRMVLYQSLITQPSAQLFSGNKALQTSCSEDYLPRHRTGMSISLPVSSAFSLYRLRALQIIFPATGQAYRFFLLLQRTRSYRLRALKIIFPATGQAFRFFLLLQRTRSYRLRALRIIFPATGQAYRFFLLLQHPRSYGLQALRIILPVTRKACWFSLLPQQAMILQASGFANDRLRHQTVSIFPAALESEDHYSNSTSFRLRALTIIFPCFIFQDLHLGNKTL